MSNITSNMYQRIILSISVGIPCPCCPPIRPPPAGSGTVGANGSHDLVNGDANPIPGTNLGNGAISTVPTSTLLANNSLSGQPDSPLTHTPASNCHRFSLNNESTAKGILGISIF